MLVGQYPRYPLNIATGLISRIGSVIWAAIGKSRHDVSNSGEGGQDQNASCWQRAFHPHNHVMDLIACPRGSRERNMRRLRQRFPISVRVSRGEPRLPTGTLINSELSLGSPSYVGPVALSVDMGTVRQTQLPGVFQLSIWLQRITRSFSDFSILTSCKLQAQTAKLNLICFEPG